MNLQSYNILIVDDDKTFGESVKQALTRTGFRAYHVTSPSDALSYIKLQDVHGLIIDCMLPKMNGLELVKQLSAHLNGSPPILLMSGIFKDKQFINSSVKKTGAIDFLTKPFNLEDLTRKMQDHFTGGESVGSELAPLVQLYLSRDMKVRKMIRLINSCEGLHNFDLPWVFSILSEAKVTGHLNIACTNGDIAGVGFLEGSIVQVNIKNEESLLGLLLVEQNFLDREDLDHAVNMKEQTSRIGELLVKENFVSPHAIDIVLKEQITWRLKRLVADSQMELNFVTSDQVLPITKITSNDLQNYFSDTIESVVPGDWLRTHYLPLTQNIVAFNKDNESRMQSLKIIPFISRIFAAIEAPLDRGTTIEELLGSHHEHEETILKAIHFLNISGCLKFTEVQKNANLSHQIQRLQRLESELDNKNYFERLGVSRSAKDSDIKKAYFDLAKVLHPDKLIEGTPEKVVELSRKVFEKIQVAYDTLKKEDRKQSYLNELEVGQAEKVMQADRILDKARANLLKGELSSTRKMINQVKELSPDSTEVKILSAWLDMKQRKNPSDSFINEIDRRLQQVPLQARDTAMYYHTRGLYCLLINDMERARKYFKTSLNMDSTFIDSKRELSKIESSKQSFNILTADLKDVVGALFKKK